jgi:C2H2 type zinc finger protein
MSDFECHNCHRSFTRDDSLQSHIENEVCKGKEYNVTCKYCNNKFTSKNSMYRHIREACKEVPEKKGKKNGDMYKIIKKLQEENKKLANKVEKLSSEKNPSIVNNINNINNGTINNITIVAYGKEDMQHIDRDDIIRALKTGFNSTKHLTEVVHFNPKYPKYSNIRRSNYNMKNKLMYHNGDNWVTTSDPHMIDDLYNRKRDFIEDNIDYYRDGLTKGDMTRLQRWMNVDDDDNRITRIKGELRELLFNKKNISEMNEKQPDVNIICVNESSDESLDDVEEIIDIQISEQNLKCTRVQKDNNVTIKLKKKKKIAPRNGKYKKTYRKARAKRSK